MCKFRISDGWTGGIYLGLHGKEGDEEADASSDPHCHNHDFRVVSRCDGAWHTPVFRNIIKESLSIYHCVYILKYS